MRCYRQRLEKTAALAKEMGFDYFCTTLSISPLKDAQKINAIGQSVGEQYGVAWLPSDFKKQERQAEVKTLEQSIAKLQKKQADVQAVEQLEAKSVPLTSKVMLEREDYQNLTTAAQKYVVQEKKERKLQKLLDAANATIANLKKALQEVTAELASYKSVKGKLKAGAMEQENRELKRSNALYQDIIRQHGLSHLLGKRQERQTQDIR